MCAAIRGHHRIGTVEPAYRWNTLVVHLAESSLKADALPAMVAKAQQAAEQAGSVLDAA